VCFLEVSSKPRYHFLCTHVTSICIHAQYTQHNTAYTHRKTYTHAIIVSLSHDTAVSVHTYTHSTYIGTIHIHRIYKHTDTHSLSHTHTFLHTCVQNFLSFITQKLWWRFAHGRCTKEGTGGRVAFALPKARASMTPSPRSESVSCCKIPKFINYKKLWFVMRTQQM
jgi:hypothetical protein